MLSQSMLHLVESLTHHKTAPGIMDKKAHAALEHYLPNAQHYSQAHHAA